MPKQMNDIALDSNDDLVILNNDISIVESTQQHQRQLLINDKGTFKENPTICVGLFNYLDNENPQDLLRNINIEYTRDGMQVNSIQLTNDGKININAYYA